MLHATCNPKCVCVCTRQCLLYEVRNHGADSSVPLLRQRRAPGPARHPAWGSAWRRMSDGRQRSACCQQDGALPGLILPHTYQIQVFAGLAEEEALHPVLCGFVDDVMQRSVATPAKQSSVSPTSAPSHLLINLRVRSSLLTEQPRDQTPREKQIRAGLRAVLFQPRLSANFVKKWSGCQIISLMVAEGGWGRRRVFAKSITGHQENAWQQTQKD